MLDIIQITMRVISFSSTLKLLNFLNVWFKYTLYMFSVEESSKCAVSQNKKYKYLRKFY